MARLGSAVALQAGFVEQTQAPASFALSISSSGSTASLSWPTVTGALSYGVYAGTSPESLLPVIGDQAANSANVGGLTQPIYYFQVIARLGPHSSVASALASIGTAGQPPRQSAYYGFVPSASPSASQVQSLQAENVAGYAGSYALTQSGASQNYPCIAFPASFGTPNSFSIGGFSYAMNQSGMTINGLAYNVFVDSNATYAASLSLQVS